MKRSRFIRPAKEQKPVAFNATIKKAADYKLSDYEEVCRRHGIDPEEKLYVIISEEGVWDISVALKNEIDGGYDECILTQNGLTCMGNKSCLECELVHSEMTLRNAVKMLNKRYSSIKGCIDEF